MQRDTTGESSQGWLALDCESDLGVYNLSTETPTEEMETMERIVAPSNVREAYRRVKRNGGCPGVDVRLTRRWRRRENTTRPDTIGWYRSIWRSSSIG